MRAVAKLAFDFNRCCPGETRHIFARTLTDVAPVDAIRHDVVPDAGERLAKSRIRPEDLRIGEQTVDDFAGDLTGVEHDLCAPDGLDVCELRISGHYGSGSRRSECAGDISIGRIDDGHVAFRQTVFLGKRTRKQIVGD